MRASPNDRPDIAILLPNLGAGGTERVRLTLAREFLSRGLRVEFVLLSATGELLTAIPEGATLMTLGVTRFRSAILPLAAYLRRRKPRSLLVGMWPLTSLAVWARALAGGGTRVVLSDHNDLLATRQAAASFGRLKMMASMRASYPLAQGIVGVSSGVARTTARLAGLPEARATVIHNPVSPLPPGDPPAGIADAWLAHAGPRLIAVGSLKAQKNLPLALAALRQVRERRDAQLLILGEGSLRQELQTLAADMGLTGAVHMPGYAADVRAFMRKAHLLALSSDTEGFANVIVEALSCGTPVVSTDCPYGPREILAGGAYGRLVPPGDAKGFAAAIEETLDNPPPAALLTGRAAEFSVGRAADAYLQLLLPQG
jgi:glycosyltransferase involved in cell wall biosynthesis